MPRHPSLTCWTDFDQVVRPIVEAYRTKHRFTPGAGTMKRHGYNWIVCQAYDHHDGWKAAIDRLGFPPPQLPVRNRFGRLEDWTVFERVATPIWQEFYRQHRYTPSQRALVRLGYALIVQAARKHGGLQTIHSRLGYNRTQRHPNGRAYKMNWFEPIVRQRFLLKHWPTLVADGIAPNSEEVKYVAHGLVRYARLKHGGWPKLMAEHGLVLHRTGRDNQRRYELIVTALSWRQDHGCWPSLTDIGIARHDRKCWSSATWQRFVRTTDLQPALLAKLRTAWIDYYVWTQNHAPQETADAHLHINQLTIAWHRARPPKF